MADTRAINFADPINRGHPLNRGRVAWWLTLSGGVGGGTWRDITNNKNTGVLTAMGNANNGFRATNRPGGWGNVLFDGTAGYVALGSPSSLNLLGPMTVAAWVKTTSVGAGSKSIISDCNSAGAIIQWLFEINRTAGRFGLAWSNATGSAYATPTDTGTTLVINTWYRLVAVRRGVAGSWGIDFYANGVLSSTASDSTNPSAQQGAAIGRAGMFNGNYFPGSIDDATIWNRALSPAEVLQDYNLSQRGYPGVLNRLHWPMNFAAAVVAGGNHFRRTNQFAKRTGCRQST